MKRFGDCQAKHTKFRQQKGSSCIHIQERLSESEYLLMPQTGLQVPLAIPLKRVYHETAQRK